MRVKEAMTRDVRTVSPEHRLEEVARLMLEKGIGAVPVGENGKLVGMITDRDIAVRGVASGMDATVPVARLMSTNVVYCFEDEDTARVARFMGDRQIRRLLVADRGKRLVGILSLADLATSTKSSHAATMALQGISRTGDAASLHRHQQRTGADQGDSEPVHAAQPLSQKDRAEQGDQHDAQLVDRRHPRGIAYLERAEVAKP